MVRTLNYGPVLKKNTHQEMYIQVNQLGNGECWWSVLLMQAKC
jgi:hypothetical protein